MRRRIRINGRLYEQVSAKKRRHNRRLTEAYYYEFPDSVGRWSIYSGDEGILYCYDDIPYVLVDISYGGWEDGGLEVSVWFDNDANPGRISDEVFIKDTTDDSESFIKSSVTKVLKALEPPFKKIAPKIDSLCFDAMQDAGVDYLSYDVLEPIYDELDDYLRDLSSASNRILKRMEK